MPASAAYLTKYLTASQPSKSTDDYEDSSRPKKRRKKDKSSAANNGLIIADDDADLSLRSKRNARDGDEEDTPLIYNDAKSRSAEFRKKKDSAWQTVPTEEQPQTIGTAGTTTNEDDEAERIIAAAAAESKQRRADEDADDAPAVVEMGPDDDGGQRMESGVKAGLQTAADTAMLLAQQEVDEERERNRQRKKKKKEKEEDAAEETIYRDATGRRIDVSMRRAEVRAAELEKLREEKKERESAMGEVQRQQKEQAKQELEEAKFLTLGRSADDEDMNAKLKEVVRWDDPMAQYMAEKRAEEDMKRGVQRSRTRDEGAGAKPARRNEYQGHAPPNRYGIRPGPRWDGVDRGNGFEKEWFQARGRKARNENLEYQWQMDE